MSTAIDHIQESAKQFRDSNAEHALEAHPDEQTTWLSMYSATSGQALVGILAETDDPFVAERVIATLDREALEMIAFGAALSKRQRLGLNWSWPSPATGDAEAPERDDDGDGDDHDSDRA